MSKFVVAFNTQTGEPLPHLVPELWLTFNLFPALSATPPQPQEEAPVDSGEIEAAADPVPTPAKPQRRQKPHTK